MNARSSFGQFLPVGGFGALSVVIHVLALAFDALPTGIADVWFVVQLLTVAGFILPAKIVATVFFAIGATPVAVLCPTEVLLVTAQCRYAVVFLMLTANNECPMVFYLAGNRCGIPAQVLANTLKVPSLVYTGFDNIPFSNSHVVGALCAHCPLLSVQAGTNRIIY
jgi:hypothetical protein